MVAEEEDIVTAVFQKYLTLSVQTQVEQEDCCCHQDCDGHDHCECHGDCDCH